MTAPRTTQKSRTYSKWLVATSVFAVFAMGFAAIWSSNPASGDIVTAVGSVITTLNLLYIGSGHLDLRTAAKFGLFNLRKGRPDV